MSNPQTYRPESLPTGEQQDTPAGAATDHAARNPAPGSAQQGAEPSGYKGGNPSTAGPGPTAIHSATPENRDGQLNPSAPADAGVTPASDTTTPDVTIE